MILCKTVSVLDGYKRCFCSGETENIIVIRDTVIMARLQMKDTIDKKLGERHAMKGKKEKQRQKSSLLRELLHCALHLDVRIHDDKLNCAKLLYYNTSSHCIIMMYSKKMPKKSLYLFYIVDLGSEFKFYPLNLHLLFLLVFRDGGGRG